MAKNVTDDVEDAVFIHSVGKAFDVLRAFESLGVRLGNQELALRTGLPKSTISRMTYTLARLGYLSYLPADQKYKIGDSTVALSMSLLRGLDFRFLIRTYMKELADDAEAAVGMSIRDRFEMVYLEHCRSQLHATIHRDFGTRIPLAQTAAGRAYIAALPAAEQKALFAELERRDRKGWNTLRREINESLEIFAKRGFVISMGGWHSEINGVAVPLWSSRHATIFVFNCGAPSTVLTKARIMSHVGPRLRELCARVSVIVDSQDNMKVVPPER